MRLEIGGRSLELVEGDITAQDTDAIVNAANSSLLGGGGVDGAIHRAGGPAILDECRRIRATKWPEGLPPGEAVATRGGNLKAHYVIHTVGPIWAGGAHQEEEILAGCYRSSLGCAEALGLKSVAFPAISTGAFGYPLHQATQTAVRAVRTVLIATAHVKLVRFVVFDRYAWLAYEAELRRQPRPAS